MTYAKLWPDLIIIFKVITNQLFTRLDCDLINTLWHCPRIPDALVPGGLRARHLFFRQLGSRTTIKQYGLVRSRNLLGHGDNILPFSIKKIRGELYICIFNFYFKITVSETHCHIINHSCSSLEFFFCPFWRHRDQEYISRDIKMYDIKHFNSERWKK